MSFLYLGYTGSNLELIFQWRAMERLWVIHFHNQKRATSVKWKWLNHFTRTSIVSIFFYIEFSERKKNQKFIEETKAEAKVISIFQKLTRTPLQSYAQKKTQHFLRESENKISKRRREKSTIEYRWLWYPEREPRTPFVSIQIWHSRSVIRPCHLIYVRIVM